MAKKVYIETLGCQMNKADTEKILGILSELDYEETPIPEEADLLMMNTCSIRAASENKAYSYLGVWKRFKENNPNVKIAMCGCVAQQTKEKVFSKAPQVDLVFGTHNIEELPQLIKQLDEKERVCSVLKTPYHTEENFYARRKEGISAWLPIIEGCDYFCTYCVVPYTRGRQRSRLPEEIIAEAEQILSEGYKEITLLGQTVDSYGNDFEDKSINLSYLLRELNKLNGLMRLRFVTSHPADMTEELIMTVKELDKVCEYFHLPMQSGNTEILARMRRPYTREEYLALVNKIKQKIPDVGITTDFIAGFPGETKEQFNDTLSIIDEVVFDQCNTAAYSPRKQTPASVWKTQVPLAEKKCRLNILNEKAKEATKKSNERYVGKILQVLPESAKQENGKTVLTGRARNNKLVHFGGCLELIGTHVDVEIKEALMWCLKGELRG